MASGTSLAFCRAAAVTALLSCGVARAEILSLYAVADATLMEWTVTNSMGAATWFSAGTTQNGPRARALLKFDPAAELPAGAKILSAELRLSVTRVPDEPHPESAFTIWRMLVPWGEGTNVHGATLPGWGNPAQPGDATWTHRFWDTTNTWAAPGGLEGVDYAATASSVRLIAEIDRYAFETTSEATADVQLWLDRPDLNFGWLLKTEAEDARFTARRFGSRELEDPFESPELVVEYLPPLRILGVQLVTNRVQFTFPVAPGVSYRVEFANSLPATNWMVLTNLPFAFVATNATIFDMPTNAMRCYRVRL